MEEQNVIMEEKKKREDLERLQRGLPQKWGTVKLDDDNNPLPGNCQ